MRRMRVTALAVFAFGALLAACGSPRLPIPVGTCTEGVACTPANECHQGRVSCASGSSVCVDMLVAAAEGTTCGTGLVCNAGACAALCTPNEACISTNECKVAATACASATASPVCTDTGNVADGTSCGTGVVCRGGACAPACQGGQACQPPNPCTTGVTSCPTTASDPYCILTANKEDGTACGQGLVCSAGSCVSASCQAGALCQPADPCVDGVVACSSPLAPGTCTATMAKANGAACGVGLVCSSGRCVGSPSIDSVTASPSNVPPGAPVTLAWSVAGADTLMLDPGNTALNGSSTTVSPAQTTTYTLTATNVAGVTKASITVTVSTITKMWVYCGPDHVDSTVQVNGTIQFSSVFQAGSGSPGQEIDWAVDSNSLGSVSPSRGSSTTYTAPSTPGNYKVWGTSVWDPTKKDYCSITVTARSPGSGTFTATGAMPFVARHHTATLLQDGRVLVAGGTTGFPENAAALYDPAAHSFSRTADMYAKRDRGAATLLPDGTVLMTGGGSDTGPDPAIAEVYDPTTGRFTKTGSMTSNRIGHTSTLLANGLVLVAGGSAQSPTAQLYDPHLGCFWATRGEMIEDRNEHTATLLPSGFVLITGGTVSNVVLSSAELYDPASRTFAPVGPMLLARAGHTATLLPNGLVLIVGGSFASRAAELYHPDTGQFTVTGDTVQARYGHTATALPDGKVLIAGGGDYDLAIDQYDPSAELYDPAAGTFALTGTMTIGRWKHDATPLQGGTVLLTGGQFRDHDATLDTAEIYHP
jgi:hypothetical protein